MAVTVVIPAYKCAGTLRRAIDSIVNQTHPVDEIIVVDDCSPDGAEIKKIAENFPRVKYIRNQENLGLAGSRNVGLYAARSGAVAFLDADDESHPQRIEFQLRYLTPGSVVTCNVLRLAPDAAPSYSHYTKARVKTNFSPVKNALFNRITGAALMGETDLLRQVGGYDQQLRASEDLDLYLRLLNQGYKVKKILLPLYVYYDNAAGLSKDRLKVWRSYVKVIKKFVKARFGPAVTWRSALFWSLVLGKEWMRSLIIKSKDLRQAVIGEVWRIFRADTKL
ncbi:MAG: glycosyltransferase family 2 protein [Candidatus Margulisbacteria bacterium]|jgi:glycosyltransferase involved in cell wall biosynthesis|nr:glycosyltransferase family 2 protein [Candidatus Margulisiibacteriota bacterium]